MDNTDMKLTRHDANVSIIVDLKKRSQGVNSASVSGPLKRRQQAYSTKGPGVWIEENGKPKRVPIKPESATAPSRKSFPAISRKGQPVFVEALSKQSQKGASGQSGVPRILR